MCRSAFLRFYTIMSVRVEGPCTNWPWSLKSRLWRWKKVWIACWGTPIVLFNHEDVYRMSPLRLSGPARPCLVCKRCGAVIKEVTEDKCLDAVWETLTAKPLPLVLAGDAGSWASASCWPVWADCRKRSWDEYHAVRIHFLCRPSCEVCCQYEQHAG